MKFAIAFQSKLLGLLLLVMQSSTAKITPNGIGLFASVVIDSHIIFSDTTLRNRDASNIACSKVFDYAGLSVINKAIYRQLVMGDFPTAGTYWIDGVQSGNGGGFSSTANCSESAGGFDLVGVPIKSSNSVPYCLAFVKAASPQNTFVTQLPCSNNLRSLCSIKDFDACEKVTTPSN